MRTTLGPVLGLVVVVGCGGSAFTSGDGAGGGGGTSNAGTSNAGTSNAGSAGSNIGSGGAPGSGGSSSTGGTVSCALVDCAAPPCPDGQLVTPPGQCCPVCSCDNVTCPGVACSEGPPVYAPGACCPSCPPPQPGSCQGVECLAAGTCSPGHTWSRPSGACCAGCVPDPAGVACDAIVCEVTSCAPGYVRGDLVGGCCYDCLPDPLYCTEDSDCVLADRPRPCCGCPEVISTRRYTEDPCWSALNAPRVIPQECYPDFVCDAVCGPCAEPGQARCVERRCVEKR
jgi:hypothetical protein